LGWVVAQDETSAMLRIRAGQKKIINL